jgi:hypothetical protein
LRITDEEYQQISVEIDSAALLPQIPHKPNNDKNVDRLKHCAKRQALKKAAKKEKRSARLEAKRGKSGNPHPAEDNAPPHDNALAHENAPAHAACVSVTGTAMGV